MENLGGRYECNHKFVIKLEKLKMVLFDHQNYYIE